MDKTLQKLKLAQVLLVDNANDLSMAQEFIDEASDKFIGKALEQEIKRWTEDKEQREVIAEALDHYVWELENFLKQDNSISIEEEKVNKIQADILNNEPK
jgi:hypothetical protein